MICCPQCGSARIEAQTGYSGAIHYRCLNCLHMWNNQPEESNVSEIKLPKRGYWIRVTERKPNQVTKIHEGPVWSISGWGDRRELKTVSMGADSWRYTVTLNCDDGQGFPTWEYISPPEPKEDGSVWVIPYDNNQVTLWQRRPDTSGRASQCWFSPGCGPGLAWEAIIDRERGYLLEVKRD